MKKILTIIGMVSIASTVFASAALADEVVKTCNAAIKAPGSDSTIATTIKIVKVDGKLIGQLSQVIEGQTVNAPDEAVTAEELSVRAGLTSEAADLNEAENFVQATLEAIKDPEMAPYFSAGFDVQLVRHAKLYTVGRSTHMGGTVILEASDANGKSLGSVLTGFFTFPCAK